jgi:hypothetical protein
VYDTVGRDIVCIKKVSPLASSNDAASDSDTEHRNWFTIFFGRRYGIEQVSLPALSNDAASDSDTKSRNNIVFEEMILYQKSIPASIIR